MKSVPETPHFSLNFEVIERIRLTALNLFRQTFILYRTTPEGVPYQTFPDHRSMLRIVEHISDGGMMLLSTVDDVRERWASIRNLINTENAGTPEEERSGPMDVALWLIQSATTWRTRSFVSQRQYIEWLKHLALSYAHHTVAYDIEFPTDESVAHIKHLDDYSAVDDDLIGRLPTANEQLSLLYVNPWLAYLATLQLSYHELSSDILTASSQEGK